MRKQALAYCRKSNNSHSLAALLGDPCDEPPPWFRYVIAGVFAIGAAVTGVGVVALANFGAIDTVIFTATQAGGFII